MLPTANGYIDRSSSSECLVLHNHLLLTMAHVTMLIIHGILTSEIFRRVYFCQDGISSSQVNVIYLNATQNNLLVILGHVYFSS